LKNYDIRYRSPTSVRPLLPYMKHVPTQNIRPPEHDFQGRPRCGGAGISTRSFATASRRVGSGSFSNFHFRIRDLMGQLRINALGGNLPRKEGFLAENVAISFALGFRWWRPERAAPYTGSFPSCE
jgi:hypothetical protein